MAALTSSRTPDEQAAGRSGALLWLPGRDSASFAPVPLSQDLSYRTLGACQKGRFVPPFPSLSSVGVPRRRCVKTSATLRKRFRSCAGQFVVLVTHTPRMCLPCTGGEIGLDTLARKTSGANACRPHEPYGVLGQGSVKEAIEIVKPFRRPLSPQFAHGPKTTRDGGRGLSSALHFPCGSFAGMPQRTDHNRGIIGRTRDGGRGRPLRRLRFPLAQGTRPHLARVIAVTTP